MYRSDGVCCGRRSGTSSLARRGSLVAEGGAGAARRSRRAGGDSGSSAPAGARVRRFSRTVSARAGLQCTMRGALWAVAVAAVLALAAPERRADTDFEFDEAPDLQTARSRRPRRYIYDPQSPLCRELVCKKREACLLRDAFTAQCADKKDVLRRGDTIVSARRERVDGDDEVFYEDSRGPETDVDQTRAALHRLDPSFERPPERCVGCGAEGDAGGGAQFVCGSDNRTYSSLCRLDLHNCVRRAAVRLACRGFCPCRAPPPRRIHQANALNHVIPDSQTIVLAGSVSTYNLLIREMSLIQTLGPEHLRGQNSC